MAEKVIVYSTPLCPPCEQLKKYLTSRNVEFIVKDLMMDEAAANLMASHNIRSAPALQVGDEILSGQELKPERIDALLGL
jgi:glutaredoxin